MTTFDRHDQLDRRISDALEEIAMPRVPDYLDDVFRQTARSSQRPALLAHRRFRPMTRLSLAAAAAAAVVAILVGGALLVRGPSAPSVGAPSPTPVSTPAPTAMTVVPAAQALWGDWVADAELGLPNQGPRIQLSINWDGGRDAWILTGYTNGTQVFNSDSIAAPDGQLRLAAKQTADGCMAGDVGTYAWSRSADGLFLTLTLVADQCTARSATLARTWVHTLSAVTDGGHGVLPVDNLELTLPARKFGLSGPGLADGAYDTTFDSSPYIEFLAIRNPTPFKTLCATPLEAASTLSTAASVVAYVKSLPDFTFTSTATTIDGHPATHLVGTPKAGYVCAAGDVGVFYGPNDTNWTVSPGNVQPLSVWITQNGLDAYLFWYRGDEVTATDEAAVIGSIHFITKLPTP